MAVSTATNPETPVCARVSGRLYCGLVDYRVEVSMVPGAMPRRTIAAEGQVKLVVADDHPLMLNAFRDLIRSQPNMQIVEECSDGEAALHAVRRHAPEIAVLDNQLPGRTGVEVLSVLREEQSRTRTIIMSASISDQDIYTAIQLGAAGILLKNLSPETFLSCLLKVAAGGTWYPAEIVDQAIARQERRRAEAGDIAERLTRREREVLILASEGRPTKQIAEKLGISYGTVKLYLHSIYRKLGISNRSGLMELVEHHLDDLRRRT